MDFTFITKIDTAAENLMSKGLISDALKVYKQGLDMRINLYGADSEETVKFLGNLLKKALKSSGSLMNKGDVKLCIKSLKLLKKISGKYLNTIFIPEKCEMHNALACGYKKMNKLELAKSELKSAIKCIRIHKEAQIDKASIYLNMCTVFSSLKKHKEAAEYGKRAVKAAQEDIINMKLGCSNKTRKVKLLAVAYHNLGVEEEFLKNYETALEWYKKSVNFLEKNGCRDHLRLLAEFQKTYKSAYKAINATQKKGRVSKLKKRGNSEHDFMILNKTKSISRRESLIRTQSPAKMKSSQEFTHTFTQPISKDSPIFISSIEKSEFSADISDRSSSDNDEDLESIHNYLDTPSRINTPRAPRRVRGNRRIIIAPRESTENRELSEDTKQFCKKNRPYSTDSQDFLQLMTFYSEITGSEPRTPEKFAKLFSFARKIQNSLKVSTPKLEISIVPDLTVKKEIPEISEKYLKASIPPITERSSINEKSHSLEGNIDSDAKLPEEPPKNVLFKTMRPGGRLFERVRPIPLPKLETPRMNSQSYPLQNIPETLSKESPPLLQKAFQETAVTTISTPVRSLSKKALIQKYLPIEPSMPIILPPKLTSHEDPIIYPPLSSEQKPLHIILDKTIQQLKYTFSITEEISTSEHQVDSRAAYIGGKNIVFEASSHEDTSLPLPAFISQSEICEILGIQDARDISNRRDSLLKYIDIYQNKIVINRRNKIPSQIKQLLYVTIRDLPVHGECKLYIYKYAKDTDPVFENMILEVEPLKDPSNQFKPFSISDTELANVLGVTVEKLPDNYEEIADLIIIEGVYNIGISKRKPLGKEQSIMINVLSPREECKAPMLGSREIVMNEKVSSLRELPLQSGLKFIINFGAKTFTRDILNPPQDLEKAVVKIQSIFRGYRSRRPVSK